MDVPCDHIQEEALDAETSMSSEAPNLRHLSTPSSTLQNDVHDAYNAITTTSWGVRLGGLFGQVKKQSESYYEGARQELGVAGAEASKGWTELVSRTKNISNGATGGTMPSDIEPTDASEAAQPNTIVKDAEALLLKFRADTVVRLKQIQKAEDAADEALERLGVNLKSFLRMAVTIAPPLDAEAAGREPSYESKDTDGKRIVHASRFDAQLHLIHSSPNNLSKDPDSPEFTSWQKSFEVENYTAQISKDLERHENLRRVMSKLVPEQVAYGVFWTRYYFFKHAIEAEEQRRRDLLKGSQAEEEQVAWDDDDDDESRAPVPNRVVTEAVAGEAQHAKCDNPTHDKELPNSALLKPTESRKSNEHSVADSDASYDIVSSSQSRGPGSPKEDKTPVESKKASRVTEQSDEEDWE